VSTRGVEALLTTARALPGGPPKSLKTRKRAQPLTTVVPTAKFMKVRVFVASNQ